MQKQTELLAPAGNLEAFWAAVEKKADAVYIGWSDFNARVQAENFSLEDISRTIPFAHKHGVKVYIALNILLKERDLPEIVEGLRILKELSPDALIIQDMGLYYLIKRYFPAFRLHASTLMTIHNHPGAEHLRELGFRRVVLARELSIDEISAIHRHSPIELEVFVQGALCYSFSGLCLMSSYLGGKSGMRGRCVQPCRRLYESGKKHGSFFSMNDLSAIRLLPELKKAGVTSIKLEGRMRSAHYVSSIVEAYRTVLDAPEGDEEALGRAEDLIRRCLGRKPTPGYFLYPHLMDIVTPHFSGTAGLFLGKIITARGDEAMVKLAAAVGIGDRLRLVRPAHDERRSFTLGKMMAGGKELINAAQGQEITLKMPVPCRKGDLLFKVDAKDAALVRGAGRIRNLIFAATGGCVISPTTKKGLSMGPVVSKLFPEKSPGARPRKDLKWWVKLGDLNHLSDVSGRGVHRLLVLLDEKTFAQYRRYHRQILQMRHRFSWMLPPVMEEKQCRFYEKAIDGLRRAGFTYWHLGHISQRQFFLHKGRDIHLSAGYTANALNSLSVRAFCDLGITEVEFSIETDLENLKEALAHAGGCPVGLAVYGRPPLFTSRLLPPGLKPGATIRSPKKESFFINCYRELTLVHSSHPYSLLAYVQDLKKTGISFVTADFTWERPAKNVLSEILGGKPGKKPGDRVNTFNFLRTLA
ncbi:MAG: peptidase U32 family protein [Thermodesulfobacteriota bacterium]